MFHGVCFIHSDSSQEKEDINKRNSKQQPKKKTTIKSINIIIQLAHVQLREYTLEKNNSRISVHIEISRVTSEKKLIKLKAAKVRKATTEKKVARKK